MKVSITSESKKIITLSDMSTVRKIIESLKDDEITAKEYAAMAARVAAGSGRGGYVVKVYEATAQIAKNCRAWNSYTDTSANFDVWIDFAALTNEGFVIGGAYLTDIWNIDGDNHEEIRSHMYVRKFTETKQERTVARSQDTISTVQEGEKSMTEFDKVVLCQQIADKTGLELLAKIRLRDNHGDPMPCGCASVCLDGRVSVFVGDGEDDGIMPREVFNEMYEVISFSFE